LALAGFILLRITRPEPEIVEAAERSWLVEVMPVTPAAHTPVLPLYGELVAPEQTTIASPLSGRIETRPVREGQHVDSGDLLVALDDADVAPLVNQTEANVEDLQAQLRSEQVRHANDREALKGEKAILDNAQRQFERTQSLVSRGLTSQESLEAASDALARARLTVTPASGQSTSIRRVFKALRRSWPTRGRRWPPHAVTPAEQRSRRPTMAL